MTEEEEKQLTTATIVWWLKTLGFCTVAIIVGIALLK
jgi:hypothetical protein